MVGKGRELLAIVAIGLGAKGAAQTTAQATPIVHQGASVTLKVQSFEEARRQLIDLARSNGGGIADSKVNVSDKGRKNGWMRIVVPAEKMPDVLPRIYSLGLLYGDRTLTADKTSQFEELARRLTELEKHEQRLGNVLHSPKRMRGSDILYIQERLFRAGVDAESLAQWRLDLARRSRSASLIVTMFEPLPIKPPPQTPQTVAEHMSATFSTTWVSFRRFGLRMFGNLAFLLVYGVVWIPLAIIGWFLGKRLWRRLGPVLFPPDRPATPPPAPA